MSFQHDILIRSDIMEKLFTLLEEEKKRQNEQLNLIASENFASKNVRMFAGSILTNKYAEGYPKRRYYGGCEKVDEIESLAIEKACELFGVKFANVQPHSGSQANMICYMALMNEHDKLLSLSLDQGGHLSHGSPVNFSSKLYEVHHYHLGKDGRLDYELIHQMAKELKPKIILAGFSSYPFIIDFKKLHDIAKEVGAYLMADIAHIAGLIAGKAIPNPLPYVDVATSTTHKTLRGPRGGLILTNDEEIIKKINKSCFPGVQGGPLEHIIAAKAMCFMEDLSPDYQKYAHDILVNTKTCNDEFALLGDVVSGTETHLFLLNTKKSFGMSGKEAEDKLAKIGITVNKNMLPFDEEKPAITSGLRIGFAALTSRGLKPNDAKFIAHIIHDYLKGDLDSYRASGLVKSITFRLIKVENI